MSIPDLGNDPVRALALEESGTLWPAAEHAGLLRLAGESSRIVLGHAEVGTVHDLAFDANGDSLGGQRKRPLATERRPGREPLRSKPMASRIASCGASRPAGERRRLGGKRPWTELDLGRRKSTAWESTKGCPSEAVLDLLVDAEQLVWAVASGGLRLSWDAPSRASTSPMVFLRRTSGPSFAIRPGPCRGSERCVASPARARDDSSCRRWAIPPLIGSSTDGGLAWSPLGGQLRRHPSARGRSLPPRGRTSHRRLGRPARGALRRSTSGSAPGTGSDAQRGMARPSRRSRSPGRDYCAMDDCSPTATGASGSRAIAVSHDSTAGDGRPGPSTKASPVPSPTTSAKIPQGAIWFGYHSSVGLTRFDGQTFRTYDESDGLTNPAVYSLGVDAGGNPGRHGARRRPL